MNLLLTGAFPYTEEQLNKIKSIGYNITYIKEERHKLDIDLAIFDVVVCNSLFLYNDINLFSNLKYIQLTSAGFDRVPLEHVKEKGIIINNAKGVYSIPMAEWVILKILEIYKKSKVFYENQKNHIWEKQRDILELTDKNALIIGFGNVGEEIAKRLKAFNAKVIAADIREVESIYIDEFVSMDTLNKTLSKADIVILTLPLNQKTKKIVDKDFIKLLKNNSILINVARGGVINESDLISNIRRNKFLGVVLDVFEEEPLCEKSELWDLTNVIITPHNSFVSNKINDRMFSLIREKLTNFYEENV